MEDKEVILDGLAYLIVHPAIHIGKNPNADTHDPDYDGHEWYCDFIMESGEHGWEQMPEEEWDALADKHWLEIFYALWQNTAD